MSDKDPTPEEWSKLRAHLREIDNMLADYKSGKIAKPMQTWPIALIVFGSMLLGAGLFAAGMWVGPLSGH